MPRLLIDEFKGINSSIASFQLKGGEFQNSQNFRARPYYNFARRKGIEPVSVETSSILGIHEVDLDGIIIPITQIGDSLNFFPDLGSETVPNPDPYPLEDPLDPNGSSVILFLIEPSMRAIQDRRVTAGHSVWTWPKLIFASDGSQLNGNVGVDVADYPANNLYGPDLLYHDSFYGNPVGTRAAALVNDLIDACRSTVNFGDYIDADLIEGQSSTTALTTSIFPGASSASAANYRTKLSDCKTGIRRLSTLLGAPTQVSTEFKRGLAADAPTCTPLASCLQIAEYSDEYFDASCVPNSCGGAFVCVGVWDGTFNDKTTSAFGCLWEVGTGAGTLHSFDGGKALLTGNGGSSITVDLIGDTATLLILGSGATVWSGAKSGYDPVGVYTKSGGCAPGPATITIVEGC